MSFVFKSIDASHITVNPFFANKLWTITEDPALNLLDPSSSFFSEASMSVYHGVQNITTWNPALNPEQQTSHGAYTRTVWNAINNLFYKGFDEAPLEHFAQGIDYFETRSIGPVINVWSFPQQIIGKGIERGSFYFEGCVDDGNGNVLDGPGGNYVGNIIYNLGLIIWTVGSFATATTLTIKGAVRFRSTRLIDSYEVICVSTADEHNMSGNISLLATQDGITNPGIGPGETGGYNNDGQCYSFVTASFFSPYVTSIGLYNDVGDLLVIAKLARPIKKAMNCDTIFVVRWDN